MPRTPEDWPKAVALAQKFPGLTQGNLRCSTLLEIERQRQVADRALILLARAVVEMECPAEVWELAEEIVMAAEAAEGSE